MLNFCKFECFFLVLLLEPKFGFFPVFLINESFGFEVIVIFVEKFFEGDLIMEASESCTGRTVFIVEPNIEPGLFVGFHGEYCDSDVIVLVLMFFVHERVCVGLVLVSPDELASVVVFLVAVINCDGDFDFIHGEASSLLQKVLGDVFRDFFCFHVEQDAEVLVFLDLVELRAFRSLHLK